VGDKEEGEMLEEGRIGDMGTERTERGREIRGRDGKA